MDGRASRDRHGIVAEGVGFSNAPGAPVTVYGSFFFPWTQPVRLAQEQTVCVNLAAKLVEYDYLWRWTTHIEPLSGSAASPIRFDQSQFAGAVLSGGQLRRGAADYIPRLSEEGLCAAELSS